MLTSLKVTLTLRCLQGSGPIYCRAVLLDSEKYRVAVGRSSKVETKNLVAAPDNFWFDNPVLSRNHAEFIVFPRQEVVYQHSSRSSKLFQADVFAFYSPRKHI